MAIDSVMYSADIPAGTYTAGDIIPLVCTDGPANVRSGRGAAKLKTIFCGMFRGQAPYFRIHVKNSDWIDDVESFAAPITAAASNTAFDAESGASQGGHDCNLTPNSGWQVYAEVVVGGTSTTANSVFALIDVDYPEVGGVTDPKKAVGLPTSIPYDVGTVPTYAYGAMVGAGWSSQSTDYFKAGYKYVLDAAEMITTSGAAHGFIAFSNAAGMGGLTRIIPIMPSTESIRYSVRYSSVLQKGPMDIKLKLFQASAGSTGVAMSHDYVKQKA